MSAQALQHQDYQPHLSVYTPAPRKPQARVIEAVVMALFLVWMGVGGVGIFGNHAWESGLNTSNSGVWERYRDSTDHEGSTNVVTDISGAIVWDADYEAFGSVTRENGDKRFNASYTGKEFDADTGLYYYNARFYDPTLGRFITEDPARSGGNWYEYGNDNPLRFVDPTGLETYAAETKIDPAGLFHHVMIVNTDKPISDPKFKVNSILEAGPDGKTNENSIFGNLVPKVYTEPKDFKADPKSFDPILIPVPKGKTMQDFQKGLEKTHQDFSDQAEKPPYALVPPYPRVNSNSYAHTLLTDNGADFKPPYIAPGWDQHVYIQPPKTPVLLAPVEKK